MQSSLLAPDLSRDPQPGDSFALFLPIFLGLGIGIYFILGFEPPTVLGLGFLIASLIFMVTTLKWRDHRLWRWLVMGAVLMAFGFALAQIRTHFLNTQLLPQRVWSTELTGEIADFERVGSGWRVLLKDAEVDGKKYVLRLSMRQKDFQPIVGAHVTVKASLMPPSPPFVPGAFDFQRNAYFQGIGGYGYVTRILKVDNPSSAEKMTWLQRYREWLAQKVHHALKQPEAGVTTALLNGQRGGIDRKTTTAMQESGLQHIISISGLHVGLMAGVVFYLTRLLMALSMRLALEWPIKKIAAAFALAAIVAYMAIVGLSPPTVRSVIMTGIVLIAIMVDREAISLRLVALSALLILLWHPESLLDIGFQLSFAAVTGLVAFYQETRSFWMHMRWQDSLIMKALRVFLLSVVTTIIATLATAPLVLLHFQKIPLLSMLSNLMATPLVTFVIMPGTFFAYLLTPFPVLGDVAIVFMGWGVGLLIDISHFIASLPSAVWRAPSLPQSSVLLLMFGGLLAVAVKGRHRWAGVVPLLVGIIPLFFNPSPDLLVARDRVILWPVPKQEKLYAEGRMDGFQKNILTQLTDTKHVESWPCQEEICDQKIGNWMLRIIRTVPALKQACDTKADLILTNYYLDRPCKTGVLVDRHSLEEKGGTAIWLDSDRIRVAYDTPDGAKRPWQQQAVQKQRWKSRFKHSNIRPYLPRGRRYDRQTEKRTGY